MAAETFLDVVRRHQLDPDRAASPEVWSPALECAPRTELERIQSEKLAAAFRYLYDDSPFYRRHFAEAGLGREDVKGLADLRRIPVTRKTDWVPDIEAHPPYGRFSPLSEARWAGGHAWMIFSTSGTTRRPRVFRHTRHDRDVWSWMSARALWAYGVRPGMLAMNCFYYGASVAAWGMHHGLERVGCAVIPGGPMPTERRAFVLEQLRPQVLLGTPSGLLTLASRYRELHGPPEQAGVRILVCAGEQGAAVPATRRRLQEAWGGAQVHDDFGCTEVAMAPLGFTCSHAEGPDGITRVHLMEDALIVEILDPVTLEPVPEGERGTLFVSNLYSEASPFLRFEMGDCLSITREPCGCGRTTARAVGGLLGREDHNLKIKGLQFFPGTFEDALRSIPGLGDEYRVEVTESYREGRPVASGSADASAGIDDRRAYRDEVEIVTEPVPGATLTAEQVAGRLRGMLGISVKVKLVPPGTLPRSEGKGLRFVDLRKSDDRSKR